MSTDYDVIVDEMMNSSFEAFLNRKQTEDDTLLHMTISHEDSSMNYDVQDNKDVGQNSFITSTSTRTTTTTTMMTTNITDDHVNDIEEQIAGQMTDIGRRTAILLPSLNMPTHQHSSSSSSTVTPVSTIATVSLLGSKNRPTTIIVYPTVSPESIVIPIVSCIFGFPILALIVICCLRHRAKMARERDRRRNYDMQDHAVSLMRFGPIHRLSEYCRPAQRPVSLRAERSLSQGFTSLELDTVVEERGSDIEYTQTETFNTETSPIDAGSYRMSLSSS